MSLNPGLKKEEKTFMSNMSESEFRALLTEFSMGQLKYMFRISRTKDAIHYYGPNKAKKYRSAIYDRIISQKVRGVECEVWQE